MNCQGNSCKWVMGARGKYLFKHNISLNFHLISYKYHSALMCEAAVLSSVFCLSLLGGCPRTQPHVWVRSSYCIIINCIATCLKPGKAQDDFTAAASYSKWLSNYSPPVCRLFGSVCFPHLIFPTAERSAQHTHTLTLSMASCRLTNGLLMCKEVGVWTGHMQMPQQPPA